jgi:hypothetical protein
MNEFLKGRRPRLSDDEERRLWQRVRAIPDEVAPPSAAAPVPRRTARGWRTVFALPAVRYGAPALAVVLVAVIWIAQRTPERHVGGAGLAEQKAAPGSAPMLDQAPESAPAPAPGPAEEIRTLYEEAAPAPKAAPAPAPAPMAAPAPASAPKAARAASPFGAALRSEAAPPVAQDQAAHGTVTKESVAPSAVTEIEVEGGAPAHAGLQTARAGTPWQDLVVAADRAVWIDAVPSPLDPQLTVVVAAGPGPAGIASVAIAADAAGTTRVLAGVPLPEPGRYAPATPAGGGALVALLVGRGGVGEAVLVPAGASGTPGGLAVAPEVLSCRERGSFAAAPARTRLAVLAVELGRVTAEPDGGDPAQLKRLADAANGLSAERPGDPAARQLAERVEAARRAVAPVSTPPGPASR